MPKKIPKYQISSRAIQKAKSQRRYTEDEVQACLQAIKKGMPICQATQVFGIPRGVLSFRMSDNFGKASRGVLSSRKSNNFVKPSRGGRLTPEEEQKLVEWLIDSHRRGFPRKSKSLILSAKAFLDQNPRQNSFINNTPRDSWPCNFYRRHPILAEKTKEKFKKQSTACDVQDWFAKTTTYLKEQGLEHILQDPSRVFEVDESPFWISANGEVLHEVKHGIEGGCIITVMITFSANGNITPPMIVYPNELKTQKILDSVPDHWSYKVSKEGMNTQFFEDYITNILFPYLVKNNVEFPIILFVDGHTSHVTYPVNQLCDELRIILIALYPSITKVMNSRNESLLKLLKTSWTRGFEEWKKENSSSSVTEENFAPILKKVLEDCLKSKLFVDGLRKAGIYPWNSQVVDSHFYLPKPPETGESSNKTQICSEISDSTSLDYKTFKEIIGPEVLEECEKYDSYKEHSKYFGIIYDLWSAFQNQALPMPENLAFDIRDIYTMSFKEEVPDLLESSNQNDSDPLEIKEEEESWTEN